MTFTWPAKAARVLLYNDPLKVPGVARTPTTPLCVCNTAGLTAGSIPTTGISGKVDLTVSMAAAVAVLQATVIILHSCARKKREMSRHLRLTSDTGRAPYGQKAVSAT